MSNINDVKIRYQEYKKKKKEEEATQGWYADPKDRYQAYKAKKAYEDGRLQEVMQPVIDRINTYIGNGNTYIGNYYDRYGLDHETGKPLESEGDGYVYRGDTEDYLNKVTGYRDSMATEAKQLEWMLGFYKPYLNEEYYNYVTEALSGYGTALSGMVENATKDHGYYSQFEDEAAYKDAYYWNAAKEKYKGIDSLDELKEASGAFESEFENYINNYSVFNLSPAMSAEKKYLDDLEWRLTVGAYNIEDAEAELKSIGEKIELLALVYDAYEKYSAATDPNSKHYSYANYSELLRMAATKLNLAWDNGEKSTLIAQNPVKTNDFISEADSKLNAHLNSGSDDMLADFLPGGEGEKKFLKLYHSSYDALVEDYNQKKQYHDKMLQNKELLKYDAYRQKEDFAEFSEYDQSLIGGRDIDWGATIVKNGVEFVLTALKGGTSSTGPSGLEYNYDGLEYGFVNGDPKSTEWYIDEYYKDNNAIGELIRGEIAGYNLYTFLEEYEKEIYNYLYKSQGEAAAHEYLEFLTSDLKKKKADEMAKWFEDKPVLGTLYSIPAGLDQFASGFEGIFKDEYDPSVTSMAGQKIRERLADDGKILWYNLSNGSWEEMKVFGSSGAQALYDIGSTAGNMLPSILVSVAVEAALPTMGEGGVVFAGLTAAQIGAAAGAVTTGASAMGNAKQEMLSYGYSADQATAYGLMVGASEAGLSYLLSGIPGLRGGDGVFSALGQKAITKVDNAIAKAAIALGGDMLDEGLEEGLQTVLETWFKEIATGVDWEDPSIDEILYSSLLGALTSAGFGGGKLAISGTAGGVNNYIKYNKTGESFANMGGQNGVGALTAQGLGLNQNTAAYKQAQKIQTKLDAGKSASNYSVGKLLSSMSESQTSTAVQTRLSAHIENKSDVRKLSNTITDILYGREVSDKALSAVADNKYALNTLNDVLGAKLKKGATVSDVKAAVKSYQTATTSKSRADVSNATKSGSEVKISGRGGATFSVQENADGGFDVIAEASGNSGSIANYETQKQAQAAAYGYTLGMGAEGVSGLVNLSTNLPDGVNLGDAAQAFNAIYSQGKNGKAFSAVKFGELLSPEQRQYAYNLGIMDKALDGARKNSSEVLQNGKKDAKIINNKESGENEQGVRLRDGSERDGGQDSGGEVSAVESGARQDQSRDENGIRPRDREAASLAYGEEVSAKSLGIEGGLDSGRVHLIAEGSETNEMKKARARAEKRGKKVIFFAGGSLRIEQGDVVISARGYIEGDTVYVRVDHPYYTADQLMRHELGHDMIARGEVNVDEVRERISDRFEDVDFIVERYVEAYEGSGLDADEIWEEIICDSLGDMNIFAPVEVLGEMNDEFLEALKEETRKSAKDARGPPRSADGKASRENAKRRPKVPPMNEFATNAMQWAYSSKTEIGEQKLFYRKGKWVLLEKTDDGYIELGAYTYSQYELVKKEISEYNEKLSEQRNSQQREIEAVRESIMLYETDGGHNTRDRGHAWGQQTGDGSVSSLYKGESESNRVGDHQEGEHNTGHFSRELDFVDFLNENAEERERSNREILANLLESEDMSPSEKGFLTKYKNKIAQIEANEAEIAAMESELKELRKAGKKDSSRAITLEGKIEARHKEIARDENMILNLESTNSIKRLLKSEKDAAYAEGMLAGQMAQGRRDAAKLRESKEKLAEQKRKDGETLAEYKKRVAEREAEIKQKNREKLAEQREKARENLDAQAKRYQESRKKATEGRHKTAMRHKIAGVVSELDKLMRKGTKERNVKIGLQDAVAAALEIFDLNAEKVERYNKAIADLDARIAATTDPVEIEALTELRDKKIRNSERLADKLQVMKKAYENIHNGRDGENYPSYYKAECEAIENRIAEVMEKVGDTPIGDMSLEQLEAVYDMYRMVLTTVQNANKVFKDGKLADLTADAADMTSELQRIKKLAEERLKVGDDIRSFVWNELTPYYAFNRIGSDTLMSYYHELIRGQDVYARDIEEAQSFAEETRKKHGYGKWKLDQVHSFKDKDGRDFRLTLRHMMSIYAYSKREQAFDHMEKGGFFFNNKETFRKKAGVLEFIASNESGYKVDARIFAQIKGALTAEQIAYVDEMQAYLTQMGEKGNEVTRQMWGIDLFKEKAYFPLKSKEDFIYQANTPAETSSLKNDGMTKETKPHASNPIVLESFDDVWANHVEKMSKYHGFVIPIDNLNKLINYGTWMSGEAEGSERRFKPFGEQIDDVSNGVHNPRFDLYVSETPEALLKLNFTNGPLLMRNSKVKEILDKHPEMSEELLKKIPEAINDPVLIIKSKTHPTESVVVITDIMTSKGEMIVPVWIDQEGNYIDLDLEESITHTNFVASAYGRNIKALLEYANENEGFFYQSPQNKRVRQLLARNGLQLSTPLKISNSTISIPQESEDVNRNFSTNSEMGSHSISTMLEARFGPGVNDYLNTFIKDLNGAKAQSGAIATFATNLVSKFKKTSVAASLSVVVQQPTAILRALSEIDAKYFVHIPKPELLNKKWKRIQKYAPIAILKDIGGFDAGAGRQITEWINADTKRGVDRVMNKIDDITMYGAALGDRIGWSTIWTAVEREVLAKQKLDYGSEAFYEAVGKRFTDVIVKTQVYDSTLSRSGFMRGKDGLMKMATAFMGEPTLSINMLADTLLQAKRGKISKRQVVRTFASVYAATVAASIAKSFIYALRDDDEDESYAEKYMQAFGGTILNDINPLNMLPIFRDIMSMLGGWEVERTDMALIQDLINAATALGSEKKSIYRKIEDFAGAFAALAGIPLKNVMRTVREMYSLFENIFDGIEGGSFGRALAEGITGKEAGKKESLYSALISGDPERIDVYRKTYDTEERYLSAVRQALREYDPRVQRAVEGALSGSYGVYNEMKAAVKAEKHFDVKTVNNAFADEKEYVLGKLNDARKARREGNTEEYNKIIKQLVERGYSEEFIKKKLK